MLLFDAV